MRPCNRKLHALRISLNAYFCLPLLCLGIQSVRAQSSSSSYVRGSVEDQQLQHRTFSPQPTFGTVPEDFSQLCLAPGYLISFEVYRAPEMDRELRLDVNGDVEVPLIGKVNLTGKTLSEATDKLTLILKDRQLFNDPQVTLNISQYTAPTITVTGEIQSPGSYQLLTPKSLAEVLALAGGETDTAGSDIEIRRPTARDEQVVHVSYSRFGGTRASSTAMVAPGDTVYVGRAGIIYVMGAVGRPGGYVMIDAGKIDVLKAISLAQGTLPTASVGTIYLVRQLDSGQIYNQKLPLVQMQKGRAMSEPLRAGDVLWIPTSKYKSAFINASGIIAAAVSASVYAEVR